MPRGARTGRRGSPRSAVRPPAGCRRGTGRRSSPSPIPVYELDDQARCELCHFSALVVPVRPSCRIRGVCVVIRPGRRRGRPGWFWRPPARLSRGHGERNESAVFENRNTRENRGAAAPRAEGKGTVPKPDRPAGRSARLVRQVYPVRCCSGLMASSTAAPRPERAPCPWCPLNGVWCEGVAFVVSLTAARSPVVRCRLAASAAPATASTTSAVSGFVSERAMADEAPSTIVDISLMKPSCRSSAGSSRP